MQIKLLNLTVEEYGEEGVHFTQRLDSSGQFIPDMNDPSHFEVVVEVRKPSGKPFFLNGDCLFLAQKDQDGGQWVYRGKRTPQGKAE